jgi:hypothetical protein
MAFETIDVSALHHTKKSIVFIEFLLNTPYGMLIPSSGFNE